MSSAFGVGVRIPFGLLRCLIAQSIEDFSQRMDTLSTIAVDLSTPPQLRYQRSTGQRYLSALRSLCNEPHIFLLGIDHESR